MELNPQSRSLQHQVLVASIMATLSLTATVPLRAATPEPAKASVATAPAAEPARQCLTDLSAFHDEMQKDGYWRGGSGYGYGYPLNGYGYGDGYGYGYAYGGGTAAPPMGNTSAPSIAAYWHARPGYEVRTLIASAQILAQRGQQASCAVLLDEARAVFSLYAADMRSGNVPRHNGSAWRQAQLAAAEPVSGQDASYSADQLIGTEVMNPAGDRLGSVDDLVLSPQTGKIGYLVIGRGGLFGINEKYVPVPWAHFRATAGAKLLVLDTTKADMAAAPQIENDGFSARGDFDKQSQQVDAYWPEHLTK